MPLSIVAMLSLLLVASSFAQQADRHQGRSAAMHHEMQTASDLIGTKVENPQGQNLGSVTDMVIDPQSGRVRYVVLSRGGVLGVGAKLYPVPWQSLQYSTTGDRFILNVNPDQFANAPNFPRESWPDLNTGDWPQRIQSYYQGQGLGGSEGASSEMFDPNNMQTFTGKVASVSMSATRPSLQQITLKTDEGRTVLVDLAPASFLTSHDLTLQSGDRVTVRGSLVTQAGKDRLVATHLRTDQGQLQLRSTQGQPLWRSQVQEPSSSGSHDGGDSGGASFVGYELTQYGKQGQPSYGQGGSEGQRDISSGPLVRATQLIGKALQNPQNQRIGNIENLVIDIASGKVNYAVAATGGVMGVGEKLHAIPWQALNYSTNRQALMLDANKEKLETAPSFERDHWPDMSAPSWQGQVDRYYSIQTPAGGAGQMQQY